jgi:hypothetical protein
VAAVGQRAQRHDHSTSPHDSPLYGHDAMSLRTILQRKAGGWPWLIAGMTISLGQRQFGFTVLV